MKIKIGSKAFFECFDDFCSHDTDYVLIEDNPLLYKDFAHIRTRDNQDIFAYRNMSKQEFLQFELEHCKKAKMAVGKFLVPELIHYFNITIDELKKFEFAINEIDDKHSYEKVIFYSYLENDSFILSNEQLNKAYKEYKKYRN